MYRLKSIFIFLLPALMNAQNRKQIDFGVEAGTGYQYDARYLVLPGVYSLKGNNSFGAGPVFGYFRNEPRPLIGAWFSYRKLAARQESTVRLFFEAGVNYIQGMMSSLNYFPEESNYRYYFSEQFIQIAPFKIQITTVQVLPGFGGVVNIGKNATLRLAYVHGLSVDHVLFNLSSSGRLTYSLRRNLLKLSVAWRLFSVNNPDTQQINRLSTGS